MSESVTLLGTSYTLNLQGDNPPWGEQQSDLVRAIVEALSSTINESDIFNTAFNVANNQTSPTAVTGLSFNNTTVRSAIIQFSVYRVATGVEYSECGHMYCTYKSVANTWEISQVSVGFSDITFAITTSGQITYTSTNLTSPTTSVMRFRASTFSQ